MATPFKHGRLWLVVDTVYCASEESCNVWPQPRRDAGDAGGCGSGAGDTHMRNYCMCAHLSTPLTKSYKDTYYIPPVDVQERDYTSRKSASSKKWVISPPYLLTPSFITPLHLICTFATVELLLYRTLSPFSTHPAFLFLP